MAHIKVYHPKLEKNWVSGEMYLQDAKNICADVVNPSLNLGLSFKECSPSRIVQNTVYFNKKFLEECILIVIE